MYSHASLHRVDLVTERTRLCSFFWMQSLVRDRWKLGLLFELKRYISDLRIKIGDMGDVLGLVEHYHNLLRQWVDVRVISSQHLVQVLCRQCS